MNSDNIITILDLTILGNNLGSQDTDFDANNDGTVNQNDITFCNEFLGLKISQPAALYTNAEIVLKTEKEKYRIGEQIKLEKIPLAQAAEKSSKASISPASVANCLVPLPMFLSQCRNGTIVSGGYDQRGCQLPQKCIQNTTLYQCINNEDCGTSFTCPDGSIYRYFACVNSKCVSTNDSVLNCPQQINRCATYTIDGKTVQACATCKNNICEEFEKCTPSIRNTNGVSTGDCGPLHCYDDCKAQPQTLCSGIKMAWATGRVDENYSITTDTCKSFRCLTGNNVSASCYSAQQCPVSCSGKCINITQEKKACSQQTQVQSCLDSDGGLNVNIKGTVAITNGITFTDSCINENALTEVVCSGNQHQYIGYDCPFGCSGGACMSASAPRDASFIKNTGNLTIEGTLNLWVQRQTSVGWLSYKTVSEDDELTLRPGESKSLADLWNTNPPKAGNSGIYRAYGELLLTNGSMLASAYDEFQVSECVLLEAHWSKSQAREGTIVELVVEGENCDGLKINFEVREDDFLLDDKVQNEPEQATIKDGIAKSQWTAEYQYDFFTEPRYFFEATLTNVSKPQKMISDNLLIVEFGGSSDSPVWLEQGQKYFFKELILKLERVSINEKKCLLNVNNQTAWINEKATYSFPGIDISVHDAIAVFSIANNQTVCKITFKETGNQNIVLDNWYIQDIVYPLGLSYNTFSMKVEDVNIKESKCSVNIGGIIKWIEKGETKPFNFLDVKVVDVVAPFNLEMDEDACKLEFTETNTSVSFDELWLSQDTPYAVHGHTIIVENVNHKETRCGVNVDGSVKWIEKGKTGSFSNLDVNVLDLAVPYTKEYDKDSCKIEFRETDRPAEDELWISQTRPYYINNIPLKVLDVSTSEDKCRLSINDKTEWLKKFEEQTIDGFKIKIMDIVAPFTKNYDGDACNIRILETKPVPNATRKYDLASYPAPFLNNGVLYNSIMIIGENDSVENSVLGAIEIASGLQANALTRINTDSENISEHINPFTVGLIDLDKNAGQMQKNMILIGHPCGNTLIKEMLGGTCNAYFNDGEGLIKLVKSNNRHFLIVTGDSSREILYASYLLHDYAKYDLNGQEYKFKLEQEQAVQNITACTPLFVLEDKWSDCKNGKRTRKYREATGCNEFASYPESLVQECSNIYEKYSKNFTIIRESTKLKLRKDNEANIEIKTPGTYLDEDEVRERISIVKRSITVNTSGMEQLNKTAIITMYNIRLKNPIVKKDGLICIECEILSYAGDTIVFSVPHFTTYTVEGCGDELCSIEESCSTCPEDCTACPSTQKKSSDDDDTCETEWECTEWSSCMSGKKTRDCVDTNDCGETSPEEQESCTSPDELKDTQGSQNAESLRDQSQDIIEIQQLMLDDETEEQTKTSSPAKYIFILVGLIIAAIVASLVLLKINKGQGKPKEFLLNHKK